jgi:hypothetical protein
MLAGSVEFDLSQRHAEVPLGRGGGNAEFSFEILTPELAALL